ncbi:MAG: YezD family protein [Burkholderiaceae bacterium]|nr:YezD family protein [Burkholderiaceae bacterium]
MSFETVNDQNNSLVKELLSAIHSLRFGSVEITIHEGRVTQIEKREKVRFTEATNNLITPTEKSAAKNFTS